MEHRITALLPKKLVGMHKTMSVANNSTRELWQGFMPRRKEIGHAIGNDLYSIQLYDSSYFDDFSPEKPFEKWAAVETANTGNIPYGMEILEIPSGLYVVFTYKGAASAASETFRYIFGTWMPQSGYAVDNRPHFEILGEKYKNESPDSEEEIWVPIKPKNQT